MSPWNSATGGICCGIAESAKGSGLRWVHCCSSGTFLGHPKFKRIEWNAAVFQTIVDNLHKHPSYRKGPDGVGCARVIPWDYEHANEMQKMSGNVSREGLPAISWTYDLQVRNSANGAQLWALTEWLPTARKQVQNGEYQGCSVCVLPNYINPVTGINQGPTLTSIALTNSPFVQGMEPLAATANQGGADPNALDTWEKLVVAFNNSPGPNPVAKANALMCERSPLHASLPFAEQCHAAGNFVRSIMAQTLPRI